MNIAFAGLTAAGKTTHAKILAQDLNFTYVSATEILLDILKLTDDPNNVWFEKYEEIQSARTGYQLDIELERRLLDLCERNDNTVFDTWALAWISPGPMIRVWIESDKPSRVKKCKVSQTTTDLTMDECRDLIMKKDEETRDNFLKRHAFDLFSDRSRYQIILNNSHLISKATREDADAGICAFAPILKNSVTALLAEDSDAASQLSKSHPMEILKLKV